MATKKKKKKRARRPTKKTPEQIFAETMNYQRAKEQLAFIKSSKGWK